MSGVIRFVGKRVKRLHKWAADVPTTTWCERNIYLNSDASPMAGMVRFDDTPYLEEVLADFDKSHVWMQLLNWSTQVGKTFALSCAWVKAMDTDPARMQWSIKNNKDVGDYLEEKIMPFLRGVKVLRNKIKELSDDTNKKQRAASINILGGGCTFTGTTDAERRSKSVKYLFADEIALYGKGHFVELIGRTKAFERYHRKVLACSSRKHEGDEMDANYSNCETIKEWHTFCPSCEDTFYAGSEHFKFMSRSEWMKLSGQNSETFNLNEYRKFALKDVYIECPHCGNHIDNKTKDRLILERKYRFVIVEGDENGRSIGYKANALAVRITSFETIAEIWINAENEGDSDVIGQFFIDYFNEFQQRTTVTMESNELLSLGNGLGRWEIPPETYKLYMTVDTQKDHFWVMVRAYCYGRVSHVVWQGRVETFEAIEDIWVYGQNLSGNDGSVWQISKMGIDRRGYNQDGVRRTDEVDAFVAYMVSKYKSGEDDRIYCTEGHSTLTGDRSIQIVNHKDLSSNRIKYDIKIIKMNNLYLKNTLARTMERTIAKINSVEGDDAFNYSANLFFINQEDIEADREGTTSISVTRQLTSEAFDFYQDPKTGKLSKEKTWFKVSKDNHLWDCAMAGEAFAEMDKVAMAVRPMRDGLANALTGLIIS